MKRYWWLIVFIILNNVFLFSQEQIIVKPKETPVFSPGHIPTEQEVLMYKGAKAYNEKNYKEAIQYYFAFLKKDPKNLKALKQASFCYYKLGNHNYAYTLFKKVLEIDKNDKDAKEFMSFYNTLMEKKKKQFEKRNWFDPFWRSLLIPGWGQIHNNQIVKGLLFGGAFLTSLGLTIYCVNDEISKYDRYLKTNENHDLAFNKAQEAYNSALIWGVVASIVYAGGIIDSAINYDCEEAKQVYIKFDKEKIYLSFIKNW